MIARKASNTASQSVRPRLRIQMDRLRDISIIDNDYTSRF